MQEKIPHWAQELPILVLLHNAASMSALGPKEHWAKFLSNVSEDCYKHAQICNSHSNLLSEHTLQSKLTFTDRQF